MSSGAGVRKGGTQKPSLASGTKTPFDFFKTIGEREAGSLSFAFWVVFFFSPATQERKKSNCKRML